MTPIGQMRDEDRTGVTSVNHKVTIIHGHPHTPQQAWDHEEKGWPDWLVVTVSVGAAAVLASVMVVLIILAIGGVRRWLG
jgi:hypothetical protein